jgi:hypothetical protein
MKEFISFPKIGAYRNVIQDIKKIAQYAGHDDSGNAVYDENLPLPVLKFRGTVKLHGTNAGISYNPVDGIWAQSRKNIITPQDDNLGFAAWVEKNKVAVEQLFEPLKKHLRDDNTIITIFGEWAGGKIQAGMAINKVPNFWAVFDVKVSYSKEDRIFLPEDEWINMKNHDARIFNVREWKSWETEIDFEHPEKSLDFLNEVTESVEKQCPAGTFFGVEGIGEGVVWVHRSEKWGVQRFKVKGEKHSNTKPRSKKKVTVDPEIQKTIDDFVEYAVTENRLKQGIENVFTMKNRPLEMKFMGEFLSWVAHDIEEEEADVMLKSELTMKQLGKAISNKARKWFMQEINKI